MDDSLMRELEDILEEQIMEDILERKLEHPLGEITLKELYQQFLREFAPKYGLLGARFLWREMVKQAKAKLERGVNQ